MLKSQMPCVNHHDVIRAMTTSTR